MPTTLTDPTEQIRPRLVAQINAATAERGTLEARYGQVWNPSELLSDFEVLVFAAPFVVVRRKADKKLGSLIFQHRPRYYFAFEGAL